MPTLIFDGVAYGMLLFVLALGLAVTMGLMNFINLAHGAFAMVGGYAVILLMQKQGWPFLLCLPAAFVITAALGAVLERLLYRRLYGRSHLDQVLFSIGLTFMAVATVDYLVGSQQQNVQLPEFFRQRFEFGRASGCWAWGVSALHRHRLCAAGRGAAAVAGAHALAAAARAAVDDPRVAAGLGIPVDGSSCHLRGGLRASRALAGAGADIPQGSTPASRSSSWSIS